jgi:hypothetical protein
MLFAVALALVLAMLPGLAQALQKPFSDLAALDDHRLDQLRGGLDAGQGLMISFGFERVVNVNGETVARQILVVNDLTALLQGALPSLQVVANLGQVVQSGTGNFVGSSEVAAAQAAAREAAQTGSTSAAAPPAAANPAAAAAATPSAAPAAAAAPPAAAAPNAAPAGTPVSASAAPAPPTASAATAAAPVAAPAPQSLTQPMTIQTPAGTVTVNLPNTALIVQNTLNNVSIQINTALSAALNSASLARALVLSGQIR